MVETNLENINDWFRANKLTLNVNKTYCLVFGNTNTEFMKDLSINGEKMHVSNSTKFLGVWIDNKLAWHKHLEQIKVRLKSRLCMMRRGTNMLTTHAKKILYHAQIESILTYGLGTWGYLINKGQLKVLQTTQNQAIRLIEPRMQTGEIYKKHNILNLKQLTQLENFKIWKKLELGDLPTNLSSAMTLDHNENNLHKQHKYSTRNKSLPNLPNAHSQLYRKSLLFQGLRDYQLLPASIRSERKFHVFVKRCKSHLLE